MLVLLSWEMEGEMAKFGKQQKVNKISVMKEVVIITWGETVTQCLGEKR